MRFSSLRIISTQKRHILERVWYGVFALLFFLLLVAAAGAFTEPNAPPPGGNTDPPLHTGTGAQIKSGSLTINSVFAVPTLCLAGECRSVWPEEPDNSPHLPVTYLTNSQYNGNLGGKASANAKCADDIRAPSGSIYSTFEIMPWDPSGTLYHVGEIPIGFSGRTETISSLSRSSARRRVWAWHPESCRGFTSASFSDTARGYDPNRNDLIETYYANGWTRYQHSHLYDYFSCAATLQIACIAY